ncbi:MAG: ADOP family duplicated permease [Gemmatimonadaceae bacterium]
MTTDPGAPLRRVFRLPAARNRVRDSVDAEFRFHLEGRIDELIAQGLSPREAESEAWRRFGDLDDYRRQACSIDEHIIREQRRMDLFDTLARETRQALRSLTRNPGFTLIALITLAIGIGATAAIFTLLDAVVLEPLPYPHPDRLVTLTSPVPGVKPDARWHLATGEFFYFRKNSRKFDALGMWVATPLTVTGERSGQPAERAMAALVSASLFDVLGLHPALGHLFTADDNVPRNPGEVVLAHDYWERRFAGDPSVVGRSIDVGGASVRVAGVLSSGAGLPDLHIDLWLPLHMDPAEEAHNQHTFHAIGRLKPGVSAQQAQAELAPLTARLPEALPSAYSASFMKGTGFSTAVTPLRDALVGEPMARALWILFSSVALVLLIAFANVANLFLVRTDARRREMAVRGALGASRLHLALHSLTESILLCSLAGLCAVGVAYAMLGAMLRVAPHDLPRLTEIHLGWPSILFTAALSLGAGVVFGLLPLVHSGMDIGALRDGSRGLTASRHRRAVRSTLVTAQVSLALVLLAAAGLMLRSFQRLRDVQPGFDPRGVVTMSVALPYSQYQSYESVNAFYERVAAELRSLPGVTAVGMTQVLPLDGQDGCSSVFTDTPPTSSSERAACVPVGQVTPGYFEAMGIQVQGHIPDWLENDARTGGVIVSRALAQRFWPGQSAIGKGIKGNGSRPPFYHIVGIAGDVRADGLDRPAVEMVYFPMMPIAGAFLWSPPNQMKIVVRTHGPEPTSLIPAIRARIAGIDPRIPLADVDALEVLVARSMARTSFTMLLLGIAGAAALLLSAVGIYGVISYLVGQRRSEIGIRMALGARVSQVSAQVVIESLRMAVLGVLVGIIAAVGATRLLGSLLFAVSPTDPVALGGAAVLLLAIALGASYAPARRAARVDPVQALRSD